MITEFMAGDRVRVICRAEELSGGEYYGEDYDGATKMQEEGTPLYIQSVCDEDGDGKLEGLNWFRLKQLEHWVETNVNHIKVNLSTYKDDSNLTEEDKKVIAKYVKNNNLIELV